MAITAEQREQRRHYLGSSDMPVIMNVSPYKQTPQDVYWSKVADKLPDEPTESMNIGNWLEGPLVKWAAETLELEVDTEPENLFQVAGEGDGAGIFAANNDALVLERDAGIEAKFVNGELAKAFGEPYSDEVPDHVIVQVQHQMYCSGLQMVYVATAMPSFFGVERRIYTVPRDQQLIDTLVTFGMEWWVEHIEKKIPPDESAAPPMYVLKAMDRVAGSTCELTGREQLLVDQLEQVKAEKKETDKEIERLKAGLIFALGDNENGKLPDGRIVTYKEVITNRFDAKAFRKVNPTTASKFTNTSSSRRLTIKKVK
jgi:putative phage-type endonuclease